MEEMWRQVDVEWRRQVDVEWMKCGDRWMLSGDVEKGGC